MSVSSIWTLNAAAMKSVHISCCRAKSWPYCSAFSILTFHLSAIEPTHPPLQLLAQPAHVLLGLKDRAIGVPALVADVARSAERDGPAPPPAPGVLEEVTVLRLRSPNRSMVSPNALLKSRTRALRILLARLQGLPAKAFELSALRRRSTAASRASAA